jgi:uncharacterized protein YuzE
MNLVSTGFLLDPLGDRNEDKICSDTDTAYIEFSNQEVAESKDINENILINLDKNGQLVGMTIEHADAKANLSEISFQQLTKKG